MGVQLDRWRLILSVWATFNTACILGLLCWGLVRQGESADAIARVELLNEAERNGLRKAIADVQGELHKLSDEVRQLRPGQLTP